MSLVVSPGRMQGVEPGVSGLVGHWPATVWYNEAYSYTEHIA